MIHDALAIRRWIARVELFMIGMPRQFTSVGKRTVKVAIPFVVAEKVYARANPHWVCKIAAQRHESAEQTRTIRIDPEIACGAAAISFPSCGIGSVATD